MLALWTLFSASLPLASCGESGESADWQIQPRQPARAGAAIRIAYTNASRRSQHVQVIRTIGPQELVPSSSLYSTAVIWKLCLSLHLAGRAGVGYGLHLIVRRRSDAPILSVERLREGGGVRSPTGDRRGGEAGRTSFCSEVRYCTAPDVVVPTGRGTTAGTSSRAARCCAAASMERKNAARCAPMPGCAKCSSTSASTAASLRAGNCCVRSSRRS